MACSSFGNNIIIVLADAAVAAFETVVPALEAAGKLSTAEGTSLQNYVTLATTTIGNIITDIKSGSSTLPKIAAIIQELVKAYDSLGLTGQISLWVNVANGVLQELLAAILAETGGATANAVNTKAIHPGFLENRKLDGYHSRIEKVASSVKAIIAAKEALKPTEV